MNVCIFFFFVFYYTIIDVNCAAAAAAHQDTVLYLCRHSHWKLQQQQQYLNVAKHSSRLAANKCT